MSEILYSTIDGESVFELEEKRSVFIGYAKNVKTESEAKDFIAKIRSKHHDARHNCSAYLLRDGCMRYSDDGEPQGTAGIPMLEVIKKSGLVDIVIVVTRYFGGILLGAGGLVRAYSAAASGALKQAEIADYIKCVTFTVDVDYPQYDKLLRVMQSSESRVIDTLYNDKIKVMGVIASESYAEFEKKITECFAGRLNVSFDNEIIEKI